MHRIALQLEDIMGPLAITLLWSLSSFQGGTQPGELQNPVGGSDSCKQCHFNNEGTLQNNAYRGTMMDLASVDPFFLAALEIANIDNALGAELCVRCHFPGGWMAGQGTPTDGSGIATNQKVGISCDLCHRVTTPPPWQPSADGGMLLPDGTLAFSTRACESMQVLSSTEGLETAACSTEELCGHHPIFQDCCRRTPSSLSTTAAT
ncbi:MAG: hypothetical protein GY822_05440 [Deltaproteobacteria bacterium]|nr:hypothetical protein [Deltaproteobacteria bacterium]